MTGFSPELPLSPRQTVEVQLYQNGHSSIAQHFGKVKTGDADIVKKLDSPFALLPAIEQHSILIIVDDFV